MSDSSFRSSGPDGFSSTPSLTDRVLARLGDSSLTDARRAQVRRRRPTRGGLDRKSRTPEQVREARSLRRVFLEMGDAYREYRGRTGVPVSPEVRAAAYHFQKERNVASLVSVAAHLDELRILAW